MADAFTRAKMRLQDRGMHDARLTPAARLVFYEILQHLNRVSGDAWPSEERLASRLGLEVRTVRRAIHGDKRPARKPTRKPQKPRRDLGLVALGYITVEVDGRSNTYRPVFDVPPETPDKMSAVGVTPTPDILAANTGHFGSGIPDKNRPLSSLREPRERIPSRPSSSPSPLQGRTREPSGTEVGQPIQEAGRLRSQRGDERVEALLAQQFGADGYDILGKLYQIDGGQPMLRLLRVARSNPDLRVPAQDLATARLAAARGSWSRKRSAS